MTSTAAFFIGYFVGAIAVLLAVAFGVAAASRDEALRELIEDVERQQDRDVIRLEDYRRKAE